MKRVARSNKTPPPVAAKSRFLFWPKRPSPCKRSSVSGGQRAVYRSTYGSRTHTLSEAYRFRAYISSSRLRTAAAATGVTAGVAYTTGNGSFHPQAGFQCIAAIDDEGGGVLGQHTYRASIYCGGNRLEKECARGDCCCRFGCTIQTTTTAEPPVILLLLPPKAASLV